ncbi:BON domain-containing protein [Phormidesmis sp. 146-35]
MQFLTKAALSALTVLTIAEFHCIGQAQTLQQQTALPQWSRLLVADNDKADNAAEKVDDAIDNHPTLKSFDIDAGDRGDAIVLTGTVREAAHKALAEQIAKDTAPGFAIVNQLKIQ